MAQNRNPKTLFMKCVVSDIEQKILTIPRICSNECYFFNNTCFVCSLSAAAAYIHAHYSITVCIMYINC